MGLKKIIIPNSVKSILNEAFENCINLNEIQLSNNLNFIGDYCFTATALTSVEIPKSLKTISHGAFLGTQLTKITFNDVEIIMDWAFASCQSLESVEIPNTIRIIGYGAFKNGVRLKSVIIQSQNLQLGEDIFNNCIGLSKVDLFNVNITELSEKMFANCNILTIVLLPQNLTKIPFGCFANCSLLKSIDFPKSLEIIGEYSFFNSGLINIVLTENITEILSHAFSGCKNLTTIEVKINKQTIINETAFSDCDFIESISINSSFVKLFDDNNLKLKVQSIYFNSESFVDYPKINDFQNLSFVKFDKCNSDASIPAEFITNTNKSVTIEIQDNLTKINENSFSKISINEFFYCGQQIIPGNFLANSINVSNVETSNYYPLNKIGGLKFNYKHSNRCPYHKPESKLKTWHITLISVGGSLILIGVICGLVYFYIVRKAQKKLEAKSELEKAVLDDFG